MPAAPWYPWFPGDYLRDVQALTWDEDLAYRRLLDSYYSRGGPILHKHRYRMAGAVTSRQRAAVDSVIAQFFKRDGDAWRNPRADRELASRASIIEQARIAGLHSAAARRKRGATTVEGGSTTVEGGSTDPQLSTSTSTSTSTTTATPTATTTGAGEVSPATPRLRGHRASPSARTKPPRAAREKPAPPREGNGASTPVRESYAAAYNTRYGVRPVKNAKTNAMFLELVKRLGREEAPAVAAFYVRHNRAVYVGSKHAVGFLVRDAEGLRTEWATGRTVTDTEARQADKTAATGNVFGELIEEARARAGK